jgi:hypothetical protein
MNRSMWLSVALLSVIVARAPADITMMIHDDVDDYALIRAVSGQKPVKDFCAEIDALDKLVCANNRQRIEKALGKPAPKPGKDYAMPVAQHRMFGLSGIRYADEKMNKDHTEYYPIGDSAGIEVWYGINGESPQIALLYFKMNADFPQLKVVEDKNVKKSAKPEKPPLVTRKHTIDMEHWDMMKQGMTKEQIAELFSAPAGNYAPETEFPTERYGWCKGKDGKVHERLTWQSEKARIEVDFDVKGNFLTSEIYYPGRDPVTNIAERLKWDRVRFEKVRNVIEERLGGK